MPFHEKLGAIVGDPPLSRIILPGARLKWQVDPGGLCAFQQRRAALVGLKSEAFYQRSRRGPSIAPTPAGINMPRRYQMLINGAAISVQNNA